MQKERLRYIDILETVAIFLVVYSHYTLTIGTSMLANLTLVLSTTVAVPIFFMANGVLLFNSEFSLKKHCIKTAMLLVTTVVWKLLYVLAQIVNKGFNFGLYKWQDVVKFLGSNSTLEPVVPAFHFWFMYALIAIYLVYPLFRWLYDKGNRNLYCAILIVMFALVYNFDWRSANVPLAVEYCSYLLMFLVGPFIHSAFYQKGIKKERFMFLPMIVVAYLVLVYQKYHFTGTLAGEWIRLPNDYQRTATLFLTVAIFAFTATIDFKESKFFEFISMRTMNIYAVHMLFCAMFEGLVYPHLPWSNVAVHILRTILIFAVSLAITEPVSYIPVVNKILGIKPNKKGKTK